MFQRLPCAAPDELVVDTTASPLADPSDPQKADVLRSVGTGAANVPQQHGVVAKDEALAVGEELDGIQVGRHVVTALVTLPGHATVVAPMQAEPVATNPAASGTPPQHRAQCTLQNNQL